MKKHLEEGHRLCDKKKKAFERSNGVGYTCIQIGNEFNIYQNVILGRTLDGNEPSIVERWNDASDFDVDEPEGAISFDFTRSFKSQLVTMSLNMYKYIQVDFHKDNYVMARFIYEIHPDDNDNTLWFDMNRLTATIGSFGPGCETYDFDALKSSNYDATRFYGSSPEEGREMIVKLKAITCPDDHLIMTTDHSTSGCYTTWEEIKPDIIGHFILYSCGPIFSTQSNIQIADDLTIIALH
ncbi:hypothetical protein SNEBB_008741 [Seison nebaliae]|nr:hypothetical protein SNEBB_008741 [Seison nebaliae]